MKRSFTGLLLVCSFASAHALTTWNLTDDWSDFKNPNGPWSLNQGISALPQVQDFDFGRTVPLVNQPAWAPSNTGGNFLPAWFKVRTTILNHDWQVGDVVMHSTDQGNGAGSGTSNVSWTSSFEGTVDVSGKLWDVRTFARGNTWELSDNGIVLAQDALINGDGHTRANPEVFSSTSIRVHPGDVLRLSIVKTASGGEMAGVDFTVVQTSVVPEQSTSLQMLGGLGILLFGALRGRRM